MTPPARSLLRDGARLLLLALVPTLLTAWLHPKRPVWTWHSPIVAQVDLSQINQWTVPVLWVDARAASAFAEQHIPGAVSLNENEWEGLLPGFLEAWRPGVRVVVYCNTRECNASEEVARRLQRELALDEIFVLEGGWAAWQQTHP
jgi:rhodanese-related sulfurtransferase